MIILAILVIAVAVTLAMLVVTIISSIALIAIVVSITSIAIVMVMITAIVVSITMASFIANNDDATMILEVIMFLHLVLQVALEFFEDVIDMIGIIALLEEADERGDFHLMQVVNVGVLLSMLQWNREKNLFDFFLVAGQSHYAME